MIVEWQNSELVKRAVAEAMSYTDAVQTLGLRPVGRNIKTLQKYITIYEIDTSHFAPHKAKSKLRNAFALEDILSGAYPQYQSNMLRRRMISEGAIENICSECGQLPTHNGKELVLQLDHIDGNNRNHKRDNLQLLCPNCHTQTDTWGNKTRLE